jgi:branched-subunit amino acid transport protein
VTDTRLWFVIAGMGAITYALRLSMIVLLERTQVSPAVLRGLRYVPAAVFSALIAPAMARPDGPLWLVPDNPYLLAGLLAAAVAWRSRSMVLTIVLGTAALWLVR